MRVGNASTESNQYQVITAFIGLFRDRYNHQGTVRPTIYRLEDSSTRTLHCTQVMKVVPRNCNSPSRITAKGLITAESRIMAHDLIEDLTVSEQKPPAQYHAPGQPPLMPCARSDAGGKRSPDAPPCVSALVCGCCFTPSSLHIMWR